ATLVLAALPLAGVAAATSDQQAAMAAAQPQAGCTYFQETQHNLCAGFLAYWQKYGGLAVYGFPLTEEFQEQNPDTGKTYTVQYFERARFEWHPGEAPARYDVLLGRIGYWYASSHDLLGTTPFQKVSGCDAASTQGLSAAFLGSGTQCWFFGATGHTLSGAFGEYWNANGGLAVFGYPLSEPFQENGLTVQYFERARFEWHPEFAGTSSAVELGLLGDRTLMGPEVSVVTSGLDNPRHLMSQYDANSGTTTLYVAVAGKAGPNCVGPADKQVCVGNSGSILKVVNGSASTLVPNLPSEASPDGITGTNDVSSKTAGTFYYVIGGPTTKDIHDMLGDLAAPLGTLYKYDTATGQSTAVADIAGYEYANNPDKGAGTPDEPALDTNAYAVYDAGSFRLVADAGGNDLLKVDANGTISVVAVFPTVPMDAPPFLNLPPGTMLPAQAVPTSIAVGPDGNYYVGLLTGFPFQMGKASVYKITPGGQMSVYATGFTNITALAFDSLGHLFVGEIVHTGILSLGQGQPTAAAAAANPGAIYRVNMDGSKTLIANVPALGGIAFGPDSTLYATTYAAMVGAGEVVKIDY
ncbi:MAG TPA: ScyD/ScyE family protein, partial [Thermomicrobiaceae bacterium]|nr:ScyD/ScyE family protein [Thermomicrobiaceae bacterium]